MSSTSLSSLGIGALVEVGQLALGVVEAGARRRDRLELGRDLQLGILVAREAHRVLREELTGIGVVVLDVHAEEGDLRAALDRLLLEEGELRAAWRAPRRPAVDHDRIAAQLTQPGAEGVDPAVQELVGLVVHLGERGRRILRAVARLGGALRLVGSAAQQGGAGENRGGAAHCGEGWQTHGAARGRRFRRSDALMTARRAMGGATGSPLGVLVSPLLPRRRPPPFSKTGSPDG